MVSSIESSVGTERKVVTDIPGPNSQALHLRRKATVSAGLTVGFPVYIERAEGAIVVDVDGNQFLDLGSGIAVTGIGHAVPALIDAVSEQVAKFTHTCFMVTPYESYVEVCEELAELTPGTFDKTSALFNSGAEAIENAVKIARLATGRPAIVVFEHAYHGRTNLTMALTAKNMPYKDRFGPFAPEIYRVPMSYPYRDGLSGAEAAALAISIIESDVGAKNVAALLIEPIQGEGGFVVPAKGFPPGLSKWTTDNGVVLYRRRDSKRILSHWRLVRRQSRGRGTRPGRHGEGSRGRHALSGSDGTSRTDERGPRRRTRGHLRWQPRRGGGRAGHNQDLAG